MTAFVFGVTHAANESAVMHHVFSSMSAKTGVAPTYVTGAADAIQVTSGTTTSSPGPTPSAKSARWIADVHDGSAIACGTPSHFAKRDSNFAWYLFASAYHAFATASVT